MQPVTSIPSLPCRPLDGHKGTFGTVRIVAGRAGMLGAAILCARGALRGGAGLVTVALPRELQPFLAAAAPGAMTADRDPGTLVAGATSVVFGPGMGQDPEVLGLLESVLAGTDGPVVVDADGLNVLAPLGTRALGDAELVITPHPGEAGRLLGCSTQAVQDDRPAAVRALAHACGGVAVLKGAGTLVCDGARLFTNDSGHPGMGTGGSGDVLAGLLGALLAQGLSPFDAAVLGVHAHGRAGDLVAARLSQTGMIAEDLPEALAEVLEP